MDTETAPSTGGNLSTERSSSFTQSEVEITSREPERGPEPIPESSPRAHDFRAPAFLTPAQWHKLRQEHAAYADALANRLSNYLRLDISLRLARLEARTWKQFVATLADPSHLSLFKVEPHRGLGVLELAPHLGLTMVDRLLGGTGEIAAVARDLSELESTLLDQVIRICLEEWCRRWAGIQPLRPALLGHEASSRFLPVEPGNPMMFVFSVQVTLGSYLEDLTCALPCSILEALLQEPAVPVKPDAAKASASPSRTAVWNPCFSGIELKLVAQCPERQLSARELARLKPGDVLEWGPEASTGVRVLVGDATKFLGRLGTRNGKWAVEITSLSGTPRR